MQDLISQVEDLAGIEIDHTTSMVMISVLFSDRRRGAYYFALGGTADLRKTCHRQFTALVANHYPE